MSNIPLQVDEIFDQALRRAAGVERERYLAEVCGGDAERKCRVEKLLRAVADAGSFLEAPAQDPSHTVDQHSSESPGMVVGSYKLIEQIGEGGMGTVWMAQQAEPVRRLVAVKLIKAGMDSKHVLARFEAERQALALMDHPNIAKVHDAGTTDLGRPYFIMELVRGQSITKYCDDHLLTPRQRLELFVPVCHAIQHAHQKGIIHRDLKPSNVLVALYDERPVPKVIDFGVAKAAGQSLTDKTLVTGFGNIVGTLEYMSPEQAHVNQLDIDTRSDIYSLGVLLYELLTGSPPFDKQELERAGMLEMLRVIREQEPSKPSTKLSTAIGLPTLAANRGTEPAKLTKLVRGELDWIVMKALEKDRNRRYETANGFAMDVQRYLAGEPVLAAPASSAYRLRKFVRRNKGPVVAVGIVLLTLLGGIVGTTWGLWRAKQQRELAEAKKQEVEEERDAKGRALAAEQQAREKAMDALRAMTDDIVENQMVRGPTLSEESKEFLRKVIEHYEGFAAITADDAESRAIRAEGYFRVGMMRDRLGELTDAEAAYVAALGIYKQLVADFPDRPSFWNGLARCHNNLGMIFDNMGLTKEAEHANAEAITLHSQLVKSFPAEPTYRLHLAEAYINRGLLLKKTSRLKEAENEYGTGLGILRQLADDFPSRPQFRWELALCGENMGILLEDMNRFADAQTLFDDAIAVEKQLVNDFPARPAYRHKLASAYVSLGSLHWMAGSSQKAEAAWGAAIAIQKQLVADFPAHLEYRLELAHGHNNLGVAYLHRGRLKEAETALRAALELRKQLATDIPKRPDIRQHLAANYGNLGCVLEDLGRSEEAEEVFVAALDLYKQLVAQFPDQPDVRNELTSALGNLGLFRVKTRDFPAAKVLLEEAVPHHKKVLAANPGNPAYRQYYRVNLFGSVQTRAGLNDAAGAKQLSEKLRRLMERFDLSYRVAGLSKDEDSNPVSLIAQLVPDVGSSRVDLQACKLEYSIVSPK